MSIKLGKPVDKLVRREQGGWSVRSGRVNRKVDAVVAALPAYVLADLAIEDQREGHKPSLGFLAHIEHPPVGMIALGLRRSQLEHPLDGFGMLIPEREERDILGAVFNSSIFPSVAPPDHVLMTVFLGGARSPHIGHLPAADQLRLAFDELRGLLGVQGGPVFLEQAQWPRAIPQYNVGYGRILAQTQALEAALPGLHLAGNWRGGISVADTVAGAVRTAKTVAKALYP